MKRAAHPLILARDALLDDVLDPRSLYDADDALDDLLVARDAGLLSESDLDEVSGVLMAREAAARSKFTEANVDDLADLIKGNKQAAKRVVAALNADPTLGKYAEELKQGFLGDKEDE